MGLLEKTKRGKAFIFKPNKKLDHLLEKFDELYIML